MWPTHCCSHMVDVAITYDIEVKFLQVFLQNPAVGPFFYLIPVYLSQWCCMWWKYRVLPLKSRRKFLNCWRQPWPAMGITLDRTATLERLDQLVLTLTTSSHWYLWIHLSCVSLKVISVFLGPIPSKMFKDIRPISASVILDLLSASLLTGHEPRAFKTAVIKALLKGTSLDPDDVAATGLSPTFLSFPKLWRKLLRIS